MELGLIGTEIESVDAAAAAAHLSQNYRHMMNSVFVSFVMHCPDDLCR